MGRWPCRGSTAVKPTAAFRQPLIKAAIRAVDLGEVLRSSRARRWPGAVAAVLRRLLDGTCAGVQAIGRGSVVNRVNALTRSPAQRSALGNAQPGASGGAGMRAATCSSR